MDLSINVTERDCSTNTSIFRPESDVPSRCVAELPLFTSGYVIDPSQAYSVFSWASGPIASLLDDFPTLDLTRGIESTRQRSLRSFMEKYGTHDGTPVGILTSTTNLLLSEIKRHTFDVMKNIPDFTTILDPRSGGEEDEEFQQRLINTTHGTSIVDMSGIGDTVETYSANAYGRALTQYRDSSLMYKERKHISGAAIWSLMEAGKLVDPRGLIEESLRTSTPVSSLFLAACRVLGRRGPLAVLKAGFNTTEQPNGVTVDAASKAAKLIEMDNAVAIGNYPLIIDVDSILRYVMINLGLAAELIKTRPHEVARETIDSLFRAKNIKITSITNKDYTQRVERLRKDIVTGAYKDRPQIHTAVKTVTNTPGFWFDADYLNHWVHNETPYEISDNHIGENDILSPGFLREPSSYYIPELAGDNAMPSVAHLVALIVNQTIFKRDNVQKIVSNDDFTRIMKNPSTGHFLSAIDVSKSSLNNAMIAGRVKCLSQIRDMRQERLTTHKWAFWAAFVASAAQIAISQETTTDNDDTRVLIDWIVRRHHGLFDKSLALMPVNTETLQIHPLTRWMIIQRVSEIINLSTLVFDMFTSENDTYIGLIGVKALTIYHAAFDGAWVTPNHDNAPRPHLIQSFKEELSQYFFGRSNGRASQFAGSDEDATIYAAETAIAELIVKLQRYTNACGGAHIFTALVEYTKTIVDREGNAYKQCTEQDLTTALAFISKRIASIMIAVNYITLPSADNLVNLAVVALTPGATEAVLDGISVDLSPLFKSAVMNPIYRQWDVVNEQQISFSKFAQVLWPRLAADIEATARNIASIIFPRRRMLSCQHILRWSRSPPGSSLIATIYEDTQAKQSIFSYDKRNSSTFPLVDHDLAMRISGHLRGTLKSKTNDLDDELLNNDIQNAHILNAALMAVSERVDAAALASHRRFRNNGELVYLAASILFATDDDMHKSFNTNDIFSASTATDMVSREGIKALIEPLATTLASAPGLIRSRAVYNINIQTILPQTDVLHYRPIEYIAPNVQEYHSDTGGPISISDAFPARYIFPDRTIEKYKEIPIHDRNLELYDGVRVDYDDDSENEFVEDDVFADEDDEEPMDENSY